MSLHWSRAPISLGKDNHFLFCLLSWEMEEGAAEVGESQMDITLTFEEWKANKRVTGEEGKLNLPFQRVFSLHIYHGFHVHPPNYRRLVNREVKSRLSNDIFPSRHAAHASHRETTELRVKGRGEGGIVTLPFTGYSAPAALASRLEEEQEQSTIITVISDTSRQNVSVPI